MPLRWSCKDVWKVARHWIKSLRLIPLPFFTNNPGIVIWRHIPPLFNGIPWQHRPWQPHNNLPSQLFAYHSCCHQGKNLAKTHFICHQHSWHIWIPILSPHNEPYSPKVVCKKHGSVGAWNWIPVGRDSVSFPSVNQTSIHQCDCIIMTLVFKFVVDCNENSIQYWTGVIWMEVHLTILHLLRNLHCIFH